MTGLRGAARSAVVRHPLLGYLAAGMLVGGGWFAAMAIAMRLGWYPETFADFAATGAITAFAVVVCQRFPVLGLVAIGVATNWPTWWFDAPEIHIIPLFVGGFLAALRGGRPVFVVLTAGIFGLLMISSVPYWLVTSIRSGVPLLPSDVLFFDNNPSLRILSVAVELAAVALGVLLSARRRTIDELRERNRELQRLRVSDVQRIAAEERTALARDIHDVVAHHVSAMVVRAQAADRVAAERPEELRETVRWIAGSGQEALTAMRRVVRVLRQDGAGDSPAPADFSTALHRLATRMREVGVDVELSLADGLELPPAQQTVCLNVTQESLTNVLLHSDARTVRVTLGPDRDEIELSIEDDGMPRIDRAPDPRPSGSGVVGMRERVEAVGGRLTAGRRDARGWVVRAVLPVTSQPRDRARLRA